MNTIHGLTPLWEDLHLPAAAEATKSSGTKGMFADIYQAAIDAVNETDSEKNQAEYQLATGQLDNPATLMTAITKAQLSVDFLVQLRNKALDGYNELMRINL
ncbi:MAG: flagellar hook-basal body complex protein FliE [Lawsonibacter sp.]|nr:flagellar hook-basal body complex protein FliE [Lawsonibacter sp.]